MSSADSKPVVSYKVSYNPDSAHPYGFSVAIASGQSQARARQAAAWLKDYLSSRQNEIEWAARETGVSFASSEQNALSEWRKRAEGGARMTESQFAGVEIKEDP
nr:uncharacterized protein CI109_006324 [Kwoniella shandongensis]KAA5525345.1 hypothetical protein CI109_006324 [Kwoniella shandongensis]